MCVCIVRMGFSYRMYAGIVWVIWMYRDYVEWDVCAVCVNYVCAVRRFVGFSISLCSVHCTNSVLL